MKIMASLDEHQQIPELKNIIFINCVEIGERCQFLESSPILSQDMFISGRENFAALNLEHTRGAACHKCKYEKPALALRPF